MKIHSTSVYSLLLVLLTLVSCGKSGTPSENKVPGSVFHGDKIHVYQGDRRLTDEDKNLFLLDSLELQVIINNSCLRTLSEDEKSSLLGDEVKIDLGSTLDIPVQSYKLQVERELSLAELERRANEQECVVGISNNEIIRIPEIEKPIRIPRGRRIGISGITSYTHLDFMKMSEANQLYFDEILNEGEPVVLSVIDTGVDLRHEDLSGIKFVDKNGRSAYDFTDDPSAHDYHGHGTHVAGLAASMLQFNPRAIQVMSAKGLSRKGYGYLNSIFNSVIQSVHSGADIINMSLSGIMTSTYPIYLEAIGYAVRNNVLVVVAAGNDNRRVTDAYDENPTTMEGPWPSALGSIDGVINVGSIDTNSTYKSSFSNHGDNVNVWAPGCGKSDSRPFQGLPSAKTGGGYVAYCGTSMASPVLAGAAALVLKHFKKNSKAVDVAKVERILRDSLVNGVGSYAGSIDMTTLANKLAFNDLPPAPDFQVTDSYGQFVSELFSNFLVTSHQSEQVRILTKKLRDEKRSFEWLLGEIVKLYPSDKKDCVRVLRPLYFAATNRSPSTEFNNGWCYATSSGKWSLEQFINMMVMSEDFSNRIAELGLSHHPIAKIDEGRRITTSEFELRSKLESLTWELLKRPAVSKDLVLVHRSSTLDELRSQVLNSNDRYVKDLYTSILERDPDTLYRLDIGGWLYWSTQIDRSAQTRAQVKKNIENSNERWVLDMYERYTNFKPYDWQLDFYKRDLASGKKTKEQIIEEIKKEVRAPYNPTPMEHEWVVSKVNNIFYYALDRFATDKESEDYTARVYGLRDYLKQQDELKIIEKELRESPEGLLVELFMEILRKGPDLQQRRSFLVKIENGESWEQIRKLVEEFKFDEYIYSPDDGGDDDSANDEARSKITKIYEEVLGRKPDSEGLTYWVGRHKSGMSLKEIRVSISASHEAQMRRLYLYYFEREPDSEGLNYWIGRLRDGMPIDRITLNFRKASECKRHCL